MNASAGILFTFNSLPIHIPDIYFNKTNMLRLSLWDTGNQTRNALEALERTLTSDWVVTKRPQISQDYLCIL